MIIHGAWGEFKSDKMIFKKSDKIFELSKEEILAFSNIAQLIVRMLNNNSDSIHMDGYKSTLGRELNIFEKKFGSDFVRFPERFTIYHEIYYLLHEEDEEKILIGTIMKKINSKLESYRRLHPYEKFEIVFDVVVEKPGQIWKIPSNFLELDVEEVLLEDFHKFKVD